MQENCCKPANNKPSMKSGEMQAAIVVGAVN